ncbi:hypothetical protein E2562_032698 [Oryza meyeriana var. granulata]|uniref:Uncharacterized protein n=1 Tax=Oryza meyeriana var. granulata TaxID=110450 RepID=A0A6G1FF02_9ORYZ|nr:hypothetical protein E2562_032698 [Oryza meyeriana var. granulata]
MGQIDRRSEVESFHLTSRSIRAGSAAPLEAEARWGNVRARGSPTKQVAAIGGAGSSPYEASVGWRLYRSSGGDAE